MEKIGKYDIVRQIGEGGFGVVYEGVDPFLKRRVAIKTCTSDAKELRERFFREAEIAGKLQHRHIVTVHDFGVHEEIPYLVQEFLSGQDLDRMIADRNFLPSARKVEILLDVAKGLEHAHNKGVIHRDIKPGNIRVLDDASAKILDFGIAKLANVASHLTRTGMTVGTAAYLPPEQIRGASVDHRADIFSFGVTAFELLSGQRPYAGATISKLFFQILNEPAPSIVDVWPDCPAELAVLIERCLSKEPEERYTSFARIIRELNQIQANLQRARDEKFGGPTDVIPGLTSLGQALIDEEDVKSGNLPTEIEFESDSEPVAEDQNSEAVSRAEEQLAAGDPLAAQQTLRVILAGAPDHDEALSLLSQIEQRLNQARLDELDRDIRTAIASSDLDRAQQILVEAGQEGFTESHLSPLEGLVQEALESADQRQATEIGAKLEESRRLLAERQFGRAVRLYESLVRHYGKTPELEALGAEIEKTRTVENKRLTAEIRQALVESDIKEADELLAELRQVSPQHESVEKLARSIEEQREVEQQLTDILQRVEQLIHEGHLEAAFAALKAAETQHGSAPFSELQHRVRKLRHAKLDREVERRIEKAKAHLGQANLAETVSEIEKALAIDPENTAALSVLRTAQSRLRESSALHQAAGDEEESPTDLGVLGQATVRLSPEQVRAAERMYTAEVEAKQRSAPPKEQPASTTPAKLTPTPKPPENHKAVSFLASEAAIASPAPESRMPAADPAADQQPVPPPSDARPRLTLSRQNLIAAGSGIGALLLAASWFLWGSGGQPIANDSIEVAQVLASEASTNSSQRGGSTRTMPPPSTAALEPTEADDTAVHPSPSTRPEDTIEEPVPASPTESSEPVPSNLESSSSSEGILEEDLQIPVPLTPSSDDPGEASGSSTSPLESSAATEGGVDGLYLLDGAGVENAVLLEGLEPTTPAPVSGPTFSLVYVLVDAEGGVERAVPLPGGLAEEAQRQEALSLAQQAVFQPAQKDGLPGRQWSVLRIDFN